jgi:hypothetical protein
MKPASRDDATKAEVIAYHDKAKAGHRGGQLDVSVACLDWALKLFGL